MVIHHSAVCGWPALQLSALRLVACEKYLGDDERRRFANPDFARTPRGEHSA